MYKNRRMQDRERATGIDIRQEILDTLASEGTMDAAAKAMGLPLSTLHHWIRELGGETETNVRTTVEFAGFGSSNSPTLAKAA